MKNRWLQWAERPARYVELVIGIILAGYAFSQMMQTHITIWVQILFCLFVIALFIVWCCEIIRLDLTPKRKQAK